MGNLFLHIYGFFSRNAWLFIFFMAFVAGFIAFFGSGIRLEEDINKVIPASEKNSKLIKVLEHSGFADRMIICLSIKDASTVNAAEDLINYAEALIDSLNSPEASPYIRKIEGHFSKEEIAGLNEVFYEQLPVFLEKSDYIKINKKLSDSAIKRAIKSNYEALISPAGFVLRDMILKDPLALTPLVLQKLEQFKLSDNFILYKDHIFTSDKRNLIFFVIPANPATETAKNARLIQLIEHYNTALKDHSGNHIKPYYFGSMVVSLGNASQIKRDIIITVSLAAIFLLIFLSWYFRKKTSLILLFLPAIMGGGTAVALMALVKHEVSAISLGLGSVMLGISIDYALHFLSHLRYTGSVKTVIRDISKPVMISSLTTASAFLCLMVLHSEALRDLGLFAAFSVLSSAFFTLTVLPQFFRKDKGEGLHTEDHRKVNPLSKLAAYPFHKNKILVWVILALMILFAITSRKVTFEGNMDKMNYMSPELTATEDFLDSISEYRLRSVFLVSVAPTIDDALIRHESILATADSLSKKRIIHNTISVHQFYPSSQAASERIDDWQRFWDPEKRQQIKSSIDSASGVLGFKDGTFSRFYELMDYDRPFNREMLQPVRETFLNEYISNNDSLAMVTSVCKVDVNKKALVYEAFDHHPNLIVFDRQSLTSSFMEGLKDSFNLLILVSLLIVFLILTLALGRIELGIITFIPLLISWIFTMGIMGLVGIHFNIFNVVISTFVFGLGIDYAIFTLRGLMQEYQYGRRKLNSFKTAILLSGITTIAGIGVLIFAKHPALQSIALSAIIGILSVIIITFTLLPRMFNFLIKHEGKARKWPVTLKDFIFSINTLMIFLVGIILLDLATLILRCLIPLPLDQKKLLFHKMLSFSTWTIVYGSVNIKKIIWNEEQEDFKKPAIIICNHQSHLDTVLTIMQNPRMIILTNPWVHKSIFYRGFIRFADFFDVSEGREILENNIRKIVEKGYSVLYFPEGTRSADLEIGRFHQGAFHMAKELNLDILPIISYGSGNVMPKFEPFLKTSPATISIMPRVSPDSPLIKENSLATAKSFRKYYKKEYATIRKKVEMPAFFRKKVIRNYLYRGPELEWYMKIKIRLDDHYQLFHQHLPEKGIISDLGCGYGFMDYMLQQMAPQRKITGYDHDLDKVETARHIALKNDGINFIHADISMADLIYSDAFLLVDTLHYLPYEEQEKLLRNCIEHLKNGGCMIIRDADSTMRKKHLGTRISEFFSTCIGFNKTWKGKKKLFFAPREKYLDIFSQYQLNVEVIDQTKMNSNIIYIIKKQGI